MNALEIAKRIVELPRGKTFEASGLEIDYLAQAVVDANELANFYANWENETEDGKPRNVIVNFMYDGAAQAKLWLSKHAGEEK